MKDKGPIVDENGRTPLQARAEALASQVLLYTEEEQIKMVEIIRDKVVENRVGKIESLKRRIEEMEKELKILEKIKA